ncbi:sulfate ABC transporter substrate-binding protein [Auritidibacter ignavus]|uniref:sulfate ABC transporter substrate-binding protein n=1 Tax=Auritidibacter ignavus TaxID=678932 RepID=UPI00109C5E6E|nr:sulfate ABC transporter substrate-binding protein [Auritidibacter ignavus]
MYRKSRLLQNALHAALGLLSLGVLAGCAPTGGPNHVTIIGLAIGAEGNEAVGEAFNEGREDPTTFASSYGASGDQSRAVVNGLPADLVHFSIGPDMTRLVDDGLVAEDWDAGPNNGILTSTVIVLAVREGNPKDIQDWEDLIRDDVGIVSPNPGSAGAARWNMLAAWAAALQERGSEQKAEEYMEAFVDNIEAFPGSGRDATTAFLDGTGDVLVTLENEAILGIQSGENFEYIVPDRTFLSENPGAATVDASPAAVEFLDFALSAEGQSVYAEYGYRPVSSVADEVDIGVVEGATDPDNPYPEVEHLATIDDFGGWEQATEDYFSDTGTITQIIEQSGIS